MTDAELLVLYDKLYFHEIEMREKITSRLQVPLTLAVTLSGAFAFLFQHYDYARWKLDAAHTTFLFFALVSIGALIFATNSIRVAWVDNAYKFMPFAQQTADYRELLKTTYANVQNAPALVDLYTREYIVRELVESSSYNAKVNDLRSESIDKANQLILLTTAMLLIAFVTFQFGELDESKVKRPQEVTVTKPVDINLRR
jgi:hypothetical protein